ncbi:VCBS repeat-containing protein [Rhodocytophaga rosea]|uniref:VCBS repeat-containing protein n=1 Tax=Rhodocytophaga rosea TaxID=2704465 RepID=A0A6C0GK03_9BACT|nr:VCBS repeat-containing protein [Rhodocytophaga rosea]QHT68358.1 VCBS repeat-containing protein [Rhodocytophaga rosea]
MAQGICGSCHLFPEPELLDKKTWQKGVLPQMAMRLGFISLKDNPYEQFSSQEIRLIIKSMVFPSQPIVDSATWNRIVNYYISLAPEKPLPQMQKNPVKSEWHAFLPTETKLFPAKTPAITMVKYNPAKKLWFLGNRENRLYTLNNHFEITDSLLLDSPASDITYGPDHQPYVLTMGKMDPNELQAGKLVAIKPATTKKATHTILDSLSRPVHISTADLDNDGLQDKVICEFGNYTGKLVWFQQLKNGAYKEHILKQAPGALKTIIVDINNDRKPDIMTLMAQGNEGIFIYINRGEGYFEEKALLRFPPVYGSSDFELADFNSDGFIDIVYTNGDNADYSYSLKNYHGVRIFLNDGKNRFRQEWFYPLYGASKVLARDFDEDGDLDMSAISFFPDYENAPDEGFIYFENKGQLTFEPYTFKNASRGRWLTMEAGDVDDDNDLDIVLGSFVFSVIPAPKMYQQQWKKTGAEAIVLINQKKAPTPLHQQ